MNIKIAEINITNILIVLFVGVGGILSLTYQYPEGMNLCFGGLVGYMGRYIQEQTTNTTYNDYEEDEIA